MYAPEKIDYAVNRYTNEAKRLYGVIDRRLAESKYLAGDSYSIADIATFPWLRSWEKQGITLSDFPHLENWFNEISERPAVKKGVTLFTDLRKPIADDKAKEILFGATQYAKR